MAISRVYWDACVWLAIILEERNVPKKDGQFEDRYSPCNAILHAAKKGSIEIVTSTFTLAEVCESYQVKHEKADYLPSFLDHEYILLVEVDKSIALEAQASQVAGLKGLWPADAVHLATARRANVNEFHTYDDALLKLDGRIASQKGNEIKICKPGQGGDENTLFEGLN